MADVRIKYEVDKGELVLARKELEKIQKEIGVTEKETKGLSKEFKVVGGAIAAAFTLDKLVDFGKQVISITAEFQKLKAVLTNTLGSRSAADQAFKNIQDFASKTPFQVNQLTDSFVKLANQGFVPTTNELRKLGDLAASTGKEFDQLTEAIIDAQVGEFERLKEFGIRAQKQGDQVTFTFKGVQTQTEFTSESIRDYILSLGDAAGVSGSMSAISEILGGKLSNMQDNIDALFYAIGQQFNPAVGGSIDIINKLIGTITDFISVPYLDNLKEQQTEVNVLARSILGLNEEDEARNVLIAEINSKYPEFLKNLSKEELTNQNIANRLKDVNEQFRRKIDLEIADIALQEKKQEAARLLQEELKVRKFIAEFNEAAAKTDAESQAIVNFGADVYAAKLNQLAKLQIERMEITQELSEVQSEFNEVQSEYNGLANNFFEQEERLIDKSKERQEETEKQAAALREIGRINKEVIDQQIEDIEKYVEFLGEKEDAITDKEKEEAEKRKSIQRGLADAKLAIEAEVADGIIGLTKELTKETGGLAKAFIVLEKAVAIASIIINLQREIAGIAAANAILGPAGIPLTIAQVAAAKVRAGFGVATVAAQGIKQLAFKDGVIALQGPGGERSDSIPAMLSRGESVMTAKETKDFMPTLKAIRENRIDPKILNAISQGGGHKVIHAVNEVPRDIINIDENGFSKHLITKQQKSQILTSKYRT